MGAAIVRRGASPRQDVLWFVDPDNETWFARYSCGRWRGTNRYRGFTLERRRSRRPYLEAGAVRIPVRVLPALPPEGDGDIF